MTRVDLSELAIRRLEVENRRAFRRRKEAEGGFHWGSVGQAPPVRGFIRTSPVRAIYFAPAFTPEDLP